MKLSEYVYQRRKGTSRFDRKTLQEVADKAGLSKSYLSKIESGSLDNNQVSIETLLKLCNAFQDKPEDVFKSITNNKTL